MRELKEETGVHSAEIIAEVSFFFSFFFKPHMSIIILIHISLDSSSFSVCVGTSLDYV